MESTNDPKLRELLREWEVPGAPPSLDARVLDRRRSWWKFLVTGSIRVPVPVGLAVVAIVLAMAAVVMRRPASPPPASINLVDFRPVQDLNVRVIRGYEAN